MNPAGGLGYGQCSSFAPAMPRQTLLVPTDDVLVTLIEES